MINFSPIVKKITLATAGDTENLLQICLDAPFFGAKKLVPREEHFNPYGAANSTCHWSQPQNIKYTPYWKQLARPPQREFTKNEMVASRNATPFGLPGLPKRGFKYGHWCKAGAVNSAGAITRIGMAGLSANSTIDIFLCSDFTCLISQFVLL